MDIENITQPTYQKNIFIEQYADSVVDYSSSFYNSASDTFAPKHIIGTPRFYPRYGNFAETYMLVSMQRSLLDTGYFDSIFSSELTENG